MGVYDEYGGLYVQLKVGPCELKQYRVGDKVEIADGVYLGYEGVVVIKNGQLVATFAELRTKWGQVMDPAEELENWYER